MSDWRRFSISELICTPIAGRRPIGGVNEYSSGVPSLGGENIRSDGGISYDSIRLIPEDFFRAMPAGRLQANDILINKDGAQTGKVGLYDGRFEKAAINEHLFILRAVNQSVDQRLLYYYLQLPSIKTAIARRITGSAQPGLNSQFVRAISLTIPLDYKEQSFIVQAISTIDDVIQQTEALINKMQQIKMGLMHDIFTRGIMPNGQLRPPREEAPQLYKESPLGWIPKEWEILRLQQVAQVNRGKFSIRPRNDPRYYGGSVPFIQTGDVAIAAGRVISYFAQTLNSLGVSVSRMFPKGTVMVTIAANIADTCILGIPMCAPDSLVGVVPKDGENPRFIELCIRSRRLWLENRAPRTAQKNINLNDLCPLQIPYPEKNEQQRCSERYDSTDSAIFKQELAVAKYRMLKLGLVYDLLTGRVRVPEALL